MAEITRVNGDTIPFTALGREIDWVLVNVTGDMTAAGVFDEVRKVIDQYASITILGAAAATDVVFGIEGQETLNVENLDTPTYAFVEAQIDAIAGLSNTAISLLTLTGAGLS